MRYYALTISDPKTGAVYQPTRSGAWSKVGGATPIMEMQGFIPADASAGPTFTTMPNGVYDPNALQLDLDVPVSPFNRPQGDAMIAITGVGLQMLGQSADLSGAFVSLRAGMSKGLPLAKPAQAGEIVQGRVYQAYGNWQGTNQVLTLIVQSGPFQQQKYIVWQWKKGTSLAESITPALKKAFPGYPIKIAISPVLSAPIDETGFHGDIIAFAETVGHLTGRIGSKVLGEHYGGVQIIMRGSTITVFDGTQPARVVQLAFEDLMGQPMWINPQTVQFRTVLRADITTGDIIQFPAGIAAPYALTSAAAAAPMAPVSSRAAFQGQWMIQDVHHYGSSRQPTADAWNTTFTAGSLLTGQS